MTDILTQVNELATTLKQFISGLVYPLQSLSDASNTVYEEYLLDAKRNGQKMVLQKAINTIMGFAADTVYITTNTDVASQLYFYQASENFPVYFSEPSENDPVYFYNNGELGGNGADFTVNVPAAQNTTENIRRITALTNLYKLSGKTFSIVIV